MSEPADYRPMRCPNCDSLMNANSPCPECDHIDNDATCTCDHCLMQDDDDDADFNEEDGIE